MNEKGLVDDKSVIRKANKKLPDELLKGFFDALGELEDNEAHRIRNFPKTRLHKIAGQKDIYRADIDKISGWRIHLTYGADNRIYLCDVLEGKEHDRIRKVIKNRKDLYKK